MLVFKIGSGRLYKRYLKIGQACELFEKLCHQSNVHGMSSYLASVISIFRYRRAANTYYVEIIKCF